MLKAIRFRMRNWRVMLAAVGMLLSMIVSTANALEPAELITEIRSKRSGIFKARIESVTRKSNESVPVNAVVYLRGDDFDFLVKRGPDSQKFPDRVSVTTDAVLQWQPEVKWVLYHLSSNAKEHAVLGDYFRHHMGNSETGLVLEGWFPGDDDFWYNLLSKGIEDHETLPTDVAIRSDSPSKLHVEVEIRRHGFYEIDLNPANEYVMLSGKVSRIEGDLVIGEPLGKDQYYTIQVENSAFAYEGGIHTPAAGKMEGEYSESPNAVAQEGREVTITKYETDFDFSKSDAFKFESKIPDGTVAYQFTTRPSNGRPDVAPNPVSWLGGKPSNIAAPNPGAVGSNLKPRAQPSRLLILCAGVGLVAVGVFLFRRGRR